LIEKPLPVSRSFPHHRQQCRTFCSGVTARLRHSSGGLFGGLTVTGKMHRHAVARSGKGFGHSTTKAAAGACNENDWCHEQESTRKQGRLL